MPSLGGRVNERMLKSISCGLVKVGVVIPCFSFIVVTHGSFTLQSFMTFNNCVS